MRRQPASRYLGGIAATSAISIVTLMALAGSAVAQSPTATATVTYHSEPARGFRQGDDFLLPLSNLATIGWSATRKNETVTVLTDDAPVDLPIRRVGTVECISLKAVAQKLGAQVNWTSGFDAVEMMSPLTSVSVKGTKVQYEARTAVSPRVQVLSNPTRIMIDLDGARYSRGTKLDLDANARIVQFRPNSVRIIIETERTPELPTTLGPGSTGVLDFNPPPPAPPKQIDPRDKPVDSAEQDPVTTPVAPTTDAGVELALLVQTENDTSTLLTLNAPTKALKGKPVITKPQPDVLEILLPGIVGAFPPDAQFDSKAIKGVTSEIVGNATRVHIELTAAMGGEVWTDGKGVAIQLLRPANANGKIAGKVIVIDAGHGGKDKGCSAAGVNEKTLTLQIAKLTAAELANQGVTVLMTRKDDSYPTLTQRPELANRNGADMFISIHINSPGAGRRPPSGSEIYYHMNSSLSKLLGECIMKYMRQTAGVNNLGVKSDRVLYKSGLAVLRGSKMPAVLVEVGYITHPTDRKRMVDANFQVKVARSIASGIRKYLGDDQP